MTDLLKNLKNRRGKIYVLRCPISNLVRYVGQTKQSGNKRFFQHKYQWTRSKNELSYLNSWIKSLYFKNKFPIFEIIEDDIPKEDLTFKECQYIKLFMSVGAKLVNSQNPTQTYIGYSMSEKSKKKRLESLKVSKKWKERNIRHSEIIKLKHKEGISKIGFKYLSKEKLKELSNRSHEKRKRKVAIFNEHGEILQKFDSIKEAALKCNIKDSTHIVRVCKGKSKSGKTYGLIFKYIN